LIESAGEKKSNAQGIFNSSCIIVWFAVTPLFLLNNAKQVPETIIPY